MTASPENSPPSAEIRADKEALERDIEQTRNQLAGTVEALAWRVRRRRA